MKSFASLLFLAATAAAHATWQQIWVNGVDGGTSCLRRAANNNPIDVGAKELACNAHTLSPNVCTIKPGDKVTVEMHAQHGDRSCAQEAIGGNHYGPVMVYMAKVDDARTADANAADWFKVSEMGMASNNPVYWAVQVLNDNCGHWTFTVPDLAPGNYLIRSEVIALHVAGSIGGAQFYPGCFQVNVVGNGSGRPTETVKFPGAYKATDPGVLFDMYRPQSTYIIPGPRPYGTSPATVANTPYPTTATWNTALQPTTVPTVTPPVGGGTNPPPVTTVAPPVVTSQPPVPPTTQQPPVVTPTAPPSGPLQTQYGQCGGQGWNGPTQCQPPYTCTASNQWYHQCL
ncbi:endoglucanase II [Coprinopsis cinerea okayama7|uniref:AA9 family lytic polysaccharide monooxygenase AA9-X282 n=1 Tax=Coprinopsis cinerea (strain Okayama-7 / 130 / ATCC MYA-4618 / FGSC 9003) TaxID=240176 RepID=LP9_COPC7|nr:endoglucanase II [Coprinopsis cinerea okayama7\|eukprot:XP_001832511.1 endoglucanase II [Coprinopsis cinerea okayama7\